MDFQSPELGTGTAKVPYDWAGDIENGVKSHTLASSKKIKGLAMTVACYSGFL